MGASNETTTQTGTKYTIVGGRFTLRVEEGTPGAESRTLTKGKNEGKTVWEIKYASLVDYYLVGGSIQSGEYPGADILLRDAGTGEEVTVTFPLDSRYLFDLIRALPVADTSKPFNLEMHEGKKKTRTGGPTYSLRIAQNGRLLSDYYTEWKKDASGKNVAHPLHGIPEPKNGPRGWNFTEVEDFLILELERMLADYAEPSVPYHVSTGSILEDDDDRPPLTDRDAPAEDEEESDLPF